MKVRLGDDEVERNVVGVNGDAVGNELEVIADADGRCAQVAQQAVVESFAAPEAVAVAVESHCRHYDEVDRLRVNQLVAVGLFNLKSAEMERGLLVGEQFEVHAVDARKEKAFAPAPFMEKLAG